MVPTLQCGFVRSNFCLAISALFQTLPSRHAACFVHKVLERGECSLDKKALPAFQDRATAPAIPAGATAGQGRRHLSHQTLPSKACLETRLDRAPPHLKAPAPNRGLA